MHAGASFVDLLEVEGELRVATRGLHEAIAFAFASGGEQPAFATALGEADFSKSLWSGGCFRDDLFLGDLIDQCLWRGRVAPRSSVARGVRTYLLSALCHPPSGPAATPAFEFRQAISQELARETSLFEAAMALIGRLQQLFELLEAGGVGVRLDPTRRCLDILSALKAVVDECQNFGSADSGLARLADWSRHCRASEAYQRLADLLDYEARRARVTVNLRLGRQGELRGLELVSVEENAASRYHVRPFSRIFGQLSLWFRGLRVRQAEVYSRLVNDVFDGVSGWLPACLQLLGDLEFYRLGVSLARFSAERGLEVCFPELGHESRLLRDLFNPFLLLEERPPRPCDVSSGGAGTVVVLTGPNSGGKTRLIQALGICQMLAQNGLPVPASRAQLPWQDGLFASLGVGASAQQREGRLGTELLRIRNMFEKLEMGALVLVDELCSGTNPAEAEQLFGMVLELLQAMAAHAFVTTHFLEFAARLSRDPPTPGLEFLCVELDADSHPTYGFQPGVAATALAQQTARRLGVTRGELELLVRVARERRAERLRLTPRR